MRTVIFLAALLGTLAAAPAPAGRSLVWSLGGPFHEAGAEDHQGPDQPVFSGAQPRCRVNRDGSQACEGGSGRVSFHVERPSAASVPAPEYRNMIFLDANLLEAGRSYDFVFETVDQLQPDVRFTQKLIWQLHPGRGDVLTALGVSNEHGIGNEFFFNAGGGEGGNGKPFAWHGRARAGAVDDWEIQLRNAADASGWVDLYRNGVLQLHHAGPTVPTTFYDLVSFGIYDYNWNIPRAKALRDDLTVNRFDMYTIPGPVPPLGYASARR